MKGATETMLMQSWRPKSSKKGEKKFLFKGLTFVCGEGVYLPNKLECRKNISLLYQSLLFSY